ncbi:MAG: DUF3261 domain-containing protein [Gammaproteobacteria bacterium]|nr:MAG: DUF3261 domain-containing protein [Gammaproteobacteria bacterium]
MNLVRTLCISALILFTSSCATRQVQTLASLPLPDHQGGNCCWQALQQLEISYGKEHYKLTGALARTGEGVTLVLFDPFGRRLLSIHKKGEKLDTYRSPELPEGLPERFLLASSMLVWWPSADWQQTLAAEGPWRVDNTADERVLRNGEMKIIRVSYSPGSSTVVDGMSGNTVNEGAVVLQHEYQALTIKIITQRIDMLAPVTVSSGSFDREASSTSVDLSKRESK